MMAFSKNSCAPETIEELSRILQSKAKGFPVIPWGSGTHQTMGYYWEKSLADPAPLLVCSEKLNRIHDFSEQDLTITIEAGTKLNQLQHFLKEANLFFPFYSPECEKRSIGGILSTASFNLLSYRCGLIRDLVLGLTVCHSDGTITKCGGKVVKNVSGYEMTKLYTGSFGTLGYLVYCVLRVFPIPEKTIFLCLDMDDIRQGIELLNLCFTSNLPLLGGFLKIQLNSHPDEPSCCQALFWISGKEKAAEFIKNKVCALAQIFQVKTVSELKEEDAKELLNISNSRNSSEIFCSGFSPAASFLDLYEFIKNLSKGLNLNFSLKFSLQGEFSCGWDCSPVNFPDMAVEMMLEKFKSFNRFVSQKGGWLSYKKVPLQFWKNWEMWGEERAEWKYSRELKKVFDPKEILNPGRFV